METNLINQTQLKERIGGSLSAIGRYTTEFKKYISTFSQRIGKNVMYNELECKAIKAVKQLVDNDLTIEKAVKLVVIGFYEIEVECEKCNEFKIKIENLNKTISNQKEIINLLIERI